MDARQPVRHHGATRILWTDRYGTRSQCPMRSFHTLRFGLSLSAVSLVGACTGGGDRAPEERSPVDEVVGSAPAEVRGFPSVVLLHPLAPAPGSEHGQPTDTVVMDQYGMQFVPEIVLARPGQPVAFTNSDDTPHIVTVRAEGSSSTLLDEATDVGTRLDITFDRSGAYDVSCGMHPGMAGIVLVTEASYSALADRDGAWRIPDVPPGRYALDIWSADAARRWGDTIRVGSGTTVVPEQTVAGGDR